jgi:26S proteasome regulatory subunit N3
MAAEKKDDKPKAEDEAKKKAAAAAAAAAATAAAAKREEESLLVDLAAQIALIERSASTKDPKPQNRVLRQSAAIRRKLTGKAMVDAIETFIPDVHPLKQLLATAAAKVPEKPLPPAATGAPAAAPNAMDVDAAVVEKRSAVCMEVEAYLCTLLTTLLIDAKLYADAVEVSTASFARVHKVNQRTLDAVGAKLDFAYARAHELAGSLASVRSSLLAAHRTAVLHHNTLGQVVLLNLLLRSYLENNLYDQVRTWHARAHPPDRTDGTDAHPVRTDKHVQTGWTNERGSASMHGCRERGSAAAEHRARTCGGGGGGRALTSSPNKG